MDYINEQLRHLAVPIDTLKPDPANERIHDKKNIDAIKGSIKRFGQHQVVTVWKEKGVIVVGNGRWQAMKELGYDHIAANVRSFTENEAAALRIIDNRASELSHFDRAALADTIANSGIDFSDLGFDEDDIKQFGGADFGPYVSDGSGGTDGYREKLALTIKHKGMVLTVREELSKLLSDNGWEDVVEVSP